MSACVYAVCKCVGRCVSVSVCEVQNFPKFVKNFKKLDLKISIVSERVCMSVCKCVGV